MSNAKDDNVVQAMAQVARLGGFTLKSVATSDDLKERSLTIKLTRVSDGWVQDTLPYETEDLTYRVNGHGEVIYLQKEMNVGAADNATGGLGARGLGTGDLAETGAEAEKQIAAAAEGKDPDDTDPKPDIHLVGEAAATARPRMRR